MKSKLLVILLIGIMALAFVAGCGDGAADDDGAGEVTTHTIVGILPLTGALSTFGENSAAVAKLAAADVNEWLEAEGKDWRLHLEIDDDATEGPVGLTKMQSWFGEGVKIFVGPQASGVAQEMLAFANANQLLYVSPSSTSPALAIADDFLFRFCTTDEVQGPAIAAVAMAAGIEHLFFAWQGDTWGDGLQAAAKASVLELGIEVDANEIRFDPLKDAFTAEAALLDGYVSEAVAAGVPIEKIGLNVICFEQIVPFMVEALKYPQLKQIKWIGSDGTAFSEALLQTPEAAQFALDVKFANTMNKPEDGSVNYARVRDHVQEQLGRETDAYSYNTYDIVWALAKCIDQVGYDSVAAKEILPEVVKEWSKTDGASGYIELNEYGDRSFANYDIVMLESLEGWFVPGFFDGLTKEITWKTNVF